MAATEDAGLAAPRGSSTEAAAGGRQERPKLVFFGNERLATGFTTDAPALRALIAAGYDIAAVVSHHEPARSRAARQLEIAAVAEQHGIPLLLPERPADILDQLRGFGAIAGILVAYGKIVPQAVIDIFPRGIINIHPSLLPLHRGPTPVESVILAGETETGVSVMRLVKAMDAGPVYRQVRLSLRGNEDKLVLANRLLRAGTDALLDCLPGILDGSIVPRPQDDAQATYDSLLRPHDGILDFSQAAVRLERQVRAYAGWPKSRTRLADKDVVVTQAHVEPLPSAATPISGHAPAPAAARPSSVSSVPSGQAAPGGATAARLVGQPFATPDKTIAVTAGDGDLFVIDRLVPAGKTEMSAAAFLAGNQL